MRPTSPADVTAYLDDDSDIARLTDALVARRRALRMTAQEVAERMGVAQSTVNRFEHRETPAKIDVMQRYARAVGLSLRFDVEVNGNDDQWV